MTDTNATADDSPGTVALSIAGTLGHLANGEVAELRRLDDDAAVAAYWRLAARHAVLSRQRLRWVPIVRALATLTPKGPPGERADLHDKRVSDRRYGATDDRRIGTTFSDGFRLDPGVIIGRFSPRSQPMISTLPAAA